MMSASEVRNVDRGAQAERARKRRLWFLMLAVIAICAIVGAALISASHHASAGGPFVQPAVAIAGAAILVILLTGGVWVYLQWVDELEYRHNLSAFSIGFLFNLSAFIAWHLLWAGGMVHRPDAYLLFVSTAAVSGLAYLWMKVRAHFG
jgi:hypothetical protein